MDNLAIEVKHEIAEQKSVNKKSLTLAVIKKNSRNKDAKQEMVALFANKETDLKEEIKQFFNKIP